MWTLIASCALLIAKLTKGCIQDGGCGFNSLCKNGSCVCEAGFFSVDADGKNCVDGRCGHGHCYKCHDNERCKRCRDIVLEGTGKCVKECPTKTSLVISGEYEGTVCSAPKDKSINIMYIGIIAGLCGLVLILVVVGVTYYRRQIRQRDEGIEGGHVGNANGVISLQQQAADNRSG